MAKNYDATKNAWNYMMEQGRNDNFLGSMWGALRTAGTGLWDTAGNILWRDNTSNTPEASYSSMGSRGDNTSMQDIDFNDILDAYKSSSSSSSGGGGMIDISNILKAYEQEAQSNRNIAQQQYDMSRNDLLTSLKRFQEQNAIDVANQQKAYLSNQAAIEAAIAQADRQNRISAAARGLGGSGLQQLAQLQNLLSQGQTISDMATSNQSAMDALRRALSNKEEDTDTSLANALTTYNNALSTIESALASNKANIEYQARENAENRKASAAARETSNREAAQNASQYIIKTQEDLVNELKDIDSMKKSDLKTAYGTKDKAEAKRKAYNATVSAAREVLGASYQIGADTNISKTFINNLTSIYKNG